MMMRSVKKITYIILFCFVAITNVNARELISSLCEPLVENNSLLEDMKHSQGVLWKVSKEGVEPNYLFGTIHISDTEVTTLPKVVNKALLNSDHFVMEALPDMKQSMLFSQTMFFNDGKLLSTYIDKPIYEKTKEILASYQLGLDAVSVMKPWAAFFVMSYPPDQGKPLDMVLLSIARQNGAKIAGLESLKEEGDIFSELDLQEQAKLLTDTVCHYDLVKKNFKVMKSIYLKRDLAGLYHYVQRYSISDEPVYQKLMKKLINDRNNKMVQRMQSTLEKGKAFIAIGAMHLAGKQGVLSLLEEQGYSVFAVY